MSKAIWWSIVVLGLGLCALIIYYALPKTQPEPAVQLPPPVTEKPLAPAEPQIRFPLAQQPPEKPLPALEARSAGQKLLMRIGSDNTARIKAKLRELRGELTRQTLKP